MEARKDDAIAASTKDMFGKMSEYIKGEVYGEELQARVAYGFFRGHARTDASEFSSALVLPNMGMRADVCKLR